MPSEPPTVMDVGAVLFLLRERGWSVAVHNDYRLAGQAMTFWLFTHPDGTYLKGEGLTDEGALAQVIGALNARDASLQAPATESKPAAVPEGQADTDDREFSPLGNPLRPCCGQTLPNCDCPAPPSTPAGTTQRTAEQERRDVVAYLRQFPFVVAPRGHWAGGAMDPLHVAIKRGDHIGASTPSQTPFPGGPGRGGDRG